MCMFPQSCINHHFVVAMACSLVLHHMRTPEPEGVAAAPTAVPGAR